MKRMALLLLAACLAGSAWGGALPDAGVSVQQLSEEGRALYNSGKLDKAFGRFEKLLELDPKSLVASHYLARIHAVRGEFEAAINIIRALQEGGISIYRSQDSKTTLNTVINGILAVEDLKKRANHLVHFRETLRGLPASVDRRIDAHLMSIYAKLGQTQHHEIVKGRYFRSKVDAAQVFFTAGRTYLEYGVKMPDAATYFEQAADALQAQARKLEPSGNRATDALRRRLILAEASVAEDFLAYTYNAAGMQRSEKNRFAAREARPGATFMDVTAPSGIKPMPAPRVAIGDYDGDGRQDLAVRGRIYRNEDGKVFTDVTAKLGIDPRGVITSLWLDYNNDGHLDFLCGGMPRLRLWRNRGDGAFVNATLPAALGFPLAGIPEALAAADYDADGDLDLFVGCFEHPKQTAQGQANRLLRNKGAGRFEDVSEAAGLYPTETVKDLRTGVDVKHVPHYCSRGASWADYNNDGRLDLYVANYRLHPNRLWTGRGDGAFVDRAEAMGVRGLPGPDRYAGAYGHSIACAWGDIDNDGDLDLVVTDISIGRFLMFADTTSVYVNQGAGETWRFKDAFDDSGIRFQEMSTGVSLCDYDNDG
ncbi:VCBS repeat-containing protein, partial [bacterium]|nr:VCBS repeat-containing protein [bacterium]